MQNEVNTKMGACLGRNRKENSSSVSHAQSRNRRRSQEPENNGSPQFSGRKKNL